MTILFTKRGAAECDAWIRAALVQRAVDAERRAADAADNGRCAVQAREDRAADMWADQLANL